jgi:hypothetical protein
VKEMPLYLRKSVSAGPFRYNFSKGGNELSVAVKGPRIGTGPRGHHVYAGQAGVYYRAPAGQAGDRRELGPGAVSSQPLTPPSNEKKITKVEMVEVESADVYAMRDEAFADVLDEINAKHEQASMAVMLGWSVSILGLIVTFISVLIGVIIISASFAAILLGRWFDSYKRSVVLFYELEPDAEEAYKAISQAFDLLVSCKCKWHIEAAGTVRDLTTWKRNAGAIKLLRRNPTTLCYSLPAVIKSNVTPPAISVGRQVLYFLPDVALVEDRGKIGAVGYGDLRMFWKESEFVEEDAVPSDARIVNHTWKHPNKNGGPDRRFNNNYQIPVCMYEDLHFFSKTGLNEIIQLSRTGLSSSLSEAICTLQDRIKGSPRKKGKFHKPVQT